MRQAPAWTTQHSSVSLTIYRAPEPKAEVQLSQRQQTFLDSAQPGGAYKTSDYAEMTGVVNGGRTSASPFAATAISATTA